MNVDCSFERFGEKYRRRGRLRCDFGDGSGSQIFQCVDKITKEPRSMKVIKKSHCTYIEFLEEVTILKECNGHPNLCDVHDVYEDDRYYFIVMDNLDHPDLFQSLGALVSPRDVGKIIKTLLNVLTYLHDRKNPSKKYNKQIVHGKIHPKNLLVPKGGSLESLLVVDFSDAQMDLSDVIDESKFADPDLVEGDTTSSSSGDSSVSSSGSNDESEKEKEKQLRKKKRKSSHFHPPEFHKTGPTPAVDMWALGVLTFLLLTGHYPFAKPDDTKYPISNWRDITMPKLKEFIQSLLSYKPEDRPTAEEVNKTNSWHDTNFADYEESFKQVMGRLSSINKEHEFQVAVRCYISSNFLAEKDQERLEQVFRLVDSNNNNALSKDEFQRAMKELDMDIRQEAIDNYFKQLDNNNDGTVSYVEFLAYAQDEEMLFEQKKLRAAFNDLDWSNTGYITEEDLRHFSASAGGSRAFRSDKFLKNRTIFQMIELADRNGDGKISFDEFVDMMTQTRRRTADGKRYQYDKRKSRKGRKYRDKEYYAKLLHKQK